MQNDSDVQAVYLKPGEILFQEGESYKGIYIVKEGELEVFIEREDQHIVLGKMGPGEIIGTLTLFSRGPRSASIRAITFSQLELRVTQELDNILEKKCPPWVALILKDSVSRLKDSNEKIFEIEKKLQKSLKNTISPIKVSIQFARYLVNRVSQSQKREDDLVSIKNYDAECEYLFIQPAKVFEKLLDIFNRSGLIKCEKISERDVLLKEIRKSLLEGYAQFALDYLKQNKKTPFIPIKYQQVLLSLSRYMRTLPQSENPALVLFANFYEKEFKRSFNVDWLWELEKLEILKIDREKDLIEINIQWILKRFRFERTIDFIQELDEDFI